LTAQLESEPFREKYSRILIFGDRRFAFMETIPHTYYLPSLSFIKFGGFG
jgi:hypothetical protein